VYEEKILQWRKADGKKQASLAWAMNDVLGFNFWVGGLFKVIGDTAQLCGPILIKVAHPIHPFHTPWLTYPFPQQIITFTKERSDANSKGEASPNIGRGIGMAIGLLFLTIVASLCQHQVRIFHQIHKLPSINYFSVQFFWRSMVTGVLARTALISSIYKRSIDMTQKSRARFSNAAIMTHISTDVSRVDQAAQWFHAGMYMRVREQEWS
jgi:ATP-binding cassette, subfamily C (CFTR/MRP), member 1